ncbi:hypothetical protein [Halalkalibacterium halodurans]|uniref:hypothetical protein n=1 Tax=Halalkalibacterium halodurans TaxID=86665 RepID=UPI002AA9D5BB|nr:hypothetical protein [Halalkalibacterium halodurans]MDY7224682.1 hypothetical protein [Halalkalibacterium halodurans]MDY7243268.1 hypothetical protein [Halalkalibacterium halodurans]
MKHAEKVGYRERLGEILRLPPSKLRNQRLTSFMVDLTLAYAIPSSAEERQEFELDRPDVMLFYRTAEEAMTF